MSTYFCWTTLAIWTGSYCRPPGSWMDKSTDCCNVGHNVSVVCRCFQQWSVEHSHTRAPSSGRPRSTDARQDRLIMQAVMAARTTPREEIRIYVAPAVSPRTIGNRLLAAGLRSRVSLARLPLTPRHRQALLLWCLESVDWRVKWHFVVFSNECRFYLYESDGGTGVRRRPGERHLPEGIRPRHTDPRLRLHGVGVISYNSRSH